MTDPSHLPIALRRDELMRTIEANQVVIVAGETGSGKSTQLPKYCLELGRGVDGLIGHTQPRRIAARSIAERVADELGSAVGATVGYAVRFTDQVGPDTRIKLMTDGILLAEIRRDRSLRRYDTIIVDEAHERSLNIDFLLGYLHRLLPRRPDLKVIITSATIDTERFAHHFDAPIVSIEGRTYPVEMRYRPLVAPEDSDDDPPDQPEAICDAVRELARAGDGDILVFCSGEREIRDATAALTDAVSTDRLLRGTEIVPLYARLSAAQQHRVFAPHTGRRVVVATNVAETSLTVPGIRYVVDPGLARISRYSRRTKVQRLPIEPISRASADQRAGRCGRVAPGICIRLYAEDDLADRPEFTEPEIQRTSLAAVILQMASLGLGDVASFPFVDPPDHRSIRDGIALLEELGAIDPAPRDHDRELRLTPVGKQLARLPIDPRLGRMLIAAADSGCLTEVLAISSGLAIADPRERPREKQQRADELHARFTHPDSDFLTLWNLWEYLRVEQRAGSSSRFRRLCTREMLNHPRVREWQDIRSQLRQACDELGLRRNHSPATEEAIHRAVLTGIVSQVGTRIPASFEYRGTRNARFAIAPGSSLFRNGPGWVMAAELVETNRLWARVVARTRPEWVEQAATHLVTRAYTDPWWDRDRGAAVAHESVSLHGLALVGGRTVLWSRVDPDDARDLFIRHALVEGDWDTTHRFVVHNQRRIEEVHEMEARLRRADLLVDDDTLAAWFDQRIPAHVVSSRHFDRWWKSEQRTRPHLLEFELEDLITGSGPADREDFPEVWRHGDLELALTYEFDPDSPHDGITVDIPVTAIGRLDASTFEWLVPGLRTELVTALVRSLPKQLRKVFLPIPDTVAQILPLLDPAEGSLIDSLRRELSRRGGVVVGPDAFDLERLPLHLRPNYRVVADDGTPLAVGGDLDALATLVDAQVRESLASSTHPLERSGLTDWTIGDLPRVIETTGAGHTVQAYPALVDEGDSVGVQLLATAADQHRAMWAGQRRLLLLNRPGVSKTLRALLTNDVKLALVQSPYPSPGDWFDDLVACAVDQLMIEGGAPVFTATAWSALLDHVRTHLADRVETLGRASAELLRQVHGLDRALAATTAEKLAPSVADMRLQLDGLVYPGVLTAVGARHLPDLARYVAAMAWRLERLPEQPRRDRDLMVRVHAIEREHDRLLETLPWSPALEDLAWQIQELRVSLFAQSVGAAGPVSEQRIRAAMHALADPSRP